MPRGARKDVAVSKLLYENGIFLDRRSFVSLNANEPHLFLKGDDMIVQRQRVWQRDKGFCRSCKRKGVRKYLSPLESELHHIQHRGKGGSDDKGNLEIICSTCHRTEHVRPHFGERRRQAIEEFNKVNPPEA